jgi:hypothetical protein
MIHSSPRAFFCSSVMRAQVLMNVLAMVSPCKQQIQTPPPYDIGFTNPYASVVQHVGLGVEACYQDVVTSRVY